MINKNDLFSLLKSVGEDYYSEYNLSYFDEENTFIYRIYIDNVSGVYDDGLYIGLYKNIETSEVFAVVKGEDCNGNFVFKVDPNIITLFLLQELT